MGADSILQSPITVGGLAGTVLFPLFPAGSVTCEK